QVRCDGAQPACKMCELYNDDCRYDKPPPMTQLVAMAKRLQEAEQTIAALQSGADSGGDTNNMLAHEDSWASPTRLSSHNQPTSSNMHPSLSVSVNASSLPPQDESWNEGSISSARLSHSPGLTVDEQGNARYYGPTSAVRDPSQHGDSPLPNIQSGVAAYQDTSTHNSLDSHTRESAVWEEFAFGNASLHTCIPRQVIAKLLHIHFTWVGPMFLWVHRSAFIHDMATGGRHYSEFLLVVLCAHAAKYQLDSTAEMLLTRARALIGTAIQQSSSIPTIQALLQLSASELAQGSISQTWVYSGIAFRMASDLGLQYSDAVKGLDPIDLEVRRRLHWSCYFWDKVTSLYTGRLPSITESLDESSLESLDRSADSMDWTPYFGDSFHPCKISQSQYQPTSNHIVACFINSCKLSVIINDIITRIYHHQGQTVIEASFKDIKVRLNQWRTQ
ncbi:fungal-specific transcription factor domain-domain-containing protein, partial [Clohesyomyces aquaticus]